MTNHKRICKARSNMKLLLFSARPYDRQFFEPFAEQAGITINYVEARLTPDSVAIAAGSDAICAFVNDDLSETVLVELKRLGIQLICLRCAGYNNCDIKIATSLELPVVRVPSYSPSSVAEHTFAILLSLVRKIPRAYNRVRDGNYELDGLLGFDLKSRTIGVIGTGNIGTEVVKIANGFGCKVLCHDIAPNEQLTDICEYVSFSELIQSADIISLHCPLVPSTNKLIGPSELEMMKQNVILINTSRGGLIDTKAVISALKTQKLGGLGIDVYEYESSLFFEDRSTAILQDDLFARLMTFPNVIVTAHQGFFTSDALTEIARTTIDSVVQHRSQTALTHQIKPDA